MEQRRSYIATFILLLWLLRTTTVAGSGFHEACFESCMKLIRESEEVNEDKQCPKSTESLYEEKSSCHSACKNESSRKTGTSGSEDVVPVPSAPWLYNSGYNSITLRWNTSAAYSKTIAFYVLHVESKLSQLRPLEILPSTPKYIIVKTTNYTSSQTFTAQNLVNGLEYRFRVAAIGFKGLNSEYSHWSPWYPTNSSCNRTTGLIQTLFSGRQSIYFPCPVSRVTLTFSIKAVPKQPVVLDATLNWENPTAGFQNLTNLLVKVNVKLLKHEDERINTFCENYHDVDFEHSGFYADEDQTSFHLSSDTRIRHSKRSIHFGCRYIVKFTADGGIGPNSFDTTTIFSIPECVQGVTSCPISNASYDSRDVVTSDAITIKISPIAGNSLYKSNVSWNAQAWNDIHEIKFFHVTIEDWPNTAQGFYHSSDVQVLDGVTYYNVLAYNMSDEKVYRVVVRGYHGEGCLHDTVERQTFQIKRPCPQGCGANTTCWPQDVYDGTAVCRCKPGYSGNGTLCTAIEPEPMAGKEDDGINDLAIVLPLTFLLAIVAVVFALLTWRVKKKRDMVLSVIEANQSAISPSPSNTNLYQHCPPRQVHYSCGGAFSKENEVDLDEKEVNVIYVPQEIQDAISRGLTDGYEFNAEQIKFEDCLGKGAFGYVHRARALGITVEPEWTLVAVKTLSEPVTEKSVEDFIAEIELMKKLGDHENIIGMLGCCTVTLPVCLIMEFAPHGNLLTYLRTMKSRLLQDDVTKKGVESGKSVELTGGHGSKENRGIEEKSISPKLFLEGDDSLGKDLSSSSQAQRFVEDFPDLESFALQIANGMTYVAGSGIVHRDLAARNILIGQDHKLKISDFGLSKEGVYVKSTSGKIPLRWLSIEAIRERIYSTASDVWSFGIVLWEICTLGDIPYPSLSDRELLKCLISGERLEKPNNCSNEMYAMMLKCWQAVPEDRPTFAHLRDVLWKMNTGHNPYINIDPMVEEMTTSPKDNDEDPDVV